MRIWLDDERDPSDPFIQLEYRAEPDMVWVKSAEEAQQLILQGVVTLVSFDNDLGFLRPEGYDLAKWIETQANCGTIPRLDWDIHTDKCVARMNIFRAMKNADKFWDERGVPCV